MALSAVRGQEKAIGHLKASFASGRLAHAALFFGPEGVGKELTAKNFAKLLNCRSPKRGDACDFCENCLRIEKGTHPDVLWLRPMGPKRVIRIGDPDNPEPGTVRHFQRAASLKPYLGRWKIGIFTDAHCMEPTAASALLKTLEDPPAHTILILITSRPEMLLPTIVSRCRSVRFEGMRKEALQDILRRDYSLSPRDAEALCRLAEGRMGEAVRGLREDRLKRVREITARFGDGEKGYWTTVAGLLELMEDTLKRSQESLEMDLAEKGLKARSEDDEEVEEQVRAFTDGERRRREEEFLKELLVWWRDLLVWKLAPSEELLLGAARPDQMRSLARGMDAARIESALRLIESALSSLRRNADFHAVMENLLIQLTST